MLQSLAFSPNPSIKLLTPPQRRPQKMRCSAAVRSFSGVVAERKPASFYEVLRVKENASVSEIKAAYRSLAKRYHPDAGPADSDGCDFIQIHNAYETLSDPAARALYDLSLGLKRRRRSSADYVSSFGCHPAGFGRRPSRRWETDQCW